MPQHGPIQQGNPSRLGATFVDGGINFAVHAGIPATKVTLYLKDPETGEEEYIVMPGKNEENIWSVHIPDLKEGTLYGYYVDGPWSPHEGHVFNPHKLLLDPYAKAIHGVIDWSGGVVHAYNIDHPGNPERDLIMDTRDSKDHMPLGIAINADRYIERARKWREENGIPEGSAYKPGELSVLEVHIKGATKRHPALDEGQHGTYKSLTHPSFVELIKDGISTVELLPIHSFPPKDGMGHPNFWGYMTLNYFTPNNYSASADPLQEFIDMTNNLRKNGVEVMMDVVFNHTAEGNNFGPTLSLKGFDSRMYRRVPGDLRNYFDTTGCGNSLDFNHPMARRLVVESLEYFAQLGVTGFRFDLGVTLGREGPDGRYNGEALLFKEILASPILKDKVHLSAEGWDCGPDGDKYHVTNMPFASWNDKFKEDVQEFALSNNGSDPAVLAKRLTGSPDMFKKPTDSVNFVTVHDNHTLADITALKMGWTEDDLKDRKAFMAKLREDPAKAEVFATRQQFAIAMLATSLGTPLFPFGHGRGHSQHGVRDAWDLDNKSTWVNWVLGEDWQKNMLTFTKEAFEFRRRHPELQRETFFTGEVNPETGKKDITFYTPDGREMQPEDWKVGQAFCYVISGNKIADNGPNGGPVYNQDIIFFVNGGHDPVQFTVPPLRDGVAVQALNSSHQGGYVAEPGAHESGSKIEVKSRAMVALESGLKRSIDIEQEQGSRQKRSASFVRV